MTRRSRKMPGVPLCWRNGKLRIGLWLFFVLFTGCVIACAYWFRSGTHVAKVLLKVNSDTDWLSSADVDDAAAQLLSRRTVEALLTSDFVLNDALRDSKIANLPLIASAESPVRWLKDHLKVRAKSESMVISVFMYCTKSTAPEVEQIIDGVARSCMESMNMSKSNDHASRCAAIDSGAEYLRREIQAVEERISDEDSDALFELELDALQQTYVAVRRRRHEMVIERSASHPLQMLQPPSTEIRKPFWD